MINKKICIIGDYGVGKTSLLHQFKHEQFSNNYRTTIGIKIDTSFLTLTSGEKVRLVIWDLEGCSTITETNKSYLKGADGYLLVGDATRMSTIDTLITLDKEISSVLVNKPKMVLLNKFDLKDKREISRETIVELNNEGLQPIVSSAKNGTGVENAFHGLVGKLTNTL